MGQQGDSKGSVDQSAASNLATAESTHGIVAPAVSFQPGQVLAGRYRIVGKLGQGGMGEVWQAYDLKLRVDVALKSLLVDHAHEKGIEALRREVRTAREVLSPNVCRIFDLVVEGDLELISMEFVDGSTLTSMLQSDSPLELRRARDIALQFLSGLEAIHNAGLVHRDFKPENVMITRTDRVVVMDFGIAKQVAQLSGTISGTPPYMAPELLTGGKVDIRSDVFAAGIVLAEMTHPKGLRDPGNREELWKQVRQAPPEIADGPWRAVIRRAVARDPQDRYPSAQALARALEDITHRSETVDERKPYPGLAPFTQANSEYFFGRERELETVIRKLQQLHLTALIGPSGAGKTSFLQAGLVPALPEGWKSLFCQPGDAPLLNLAHALVPELSGDTEAMHMLVRLGDINVALRLMERWRARHREALLIVDRFEELFTLNPPEVQSAFAELVGRAPLEANVRVMLALRDDFLFHCHNHEPLAPIFSELTPLGPLGRASLRRALIEPALKSGYRFEDETLVDEMVAEVGKERGALPLMAFAASRLWEKRDTQAGLLTRAAYQEIGGVAGALAQHAETAMERIGAERQDVVREIFRNLVTAQGTRCVRDTEELLSVFQDRDTAREVLASLIDARLLTSFDAPQAEGQAPRSRVEVIHESLLSAWPRLVRWRTQDAGNAQLRDQLRQAAQLWEQRNRSGDLLWTGDAYREFEVWRHRYRGGLSATESAFADAMSRRAGQQRRLRRILASTVFIVLLLVLGVVSASWRSSETARRKEEAARRDAVAAAQRAEASKLLALGRAALNEDTGTALAYSLASLEMTDTPVGRLFAQEALSRGPSSLVLERPGRPSSARFSPDGKLLAVGGFGGIWVVSPKGTVSTITEGFSEIVRDQDPQFGPDSDSLVWSSADDPRIVRVWSVSRKKEVRRFQMEGPTICIVRGGTLILLTYQEADRTRTEVRSWMFDSLEPKLLGRWDLSGMMHEDNGTPILHFDISPDAAWLAYPKGTNVMVRSLQDLAGGRERQVGEHPGGVEMVRFNRQGDQLATADAAGGIRLWSMIWPSKKLIREIANGDPVQDLVFNPSGSVLSAFVMSRKIIRLWRLNIPVNAEPILIPFEGVNVGFVGFDPTGQWVVVPDLERLAFYSLRHEYAYAYRLGGNIAIGDLRFTVDARSLALSAGGIRLLPLLGQQSGSIRDLWRSSLGTEILAVDPLGRYLAVGTHREGAVLVSLPDGKVTRLVNSLKEQSIQSVAFSRDGKLVAGACSYGAAPAIQVWDVESGKVRVMEKSRGLLILFLAFSADGSLFTSDSQGRLLQWDLSSGEFRTILTGKPGGIFSFALTGDGRHLVVPAWSGANWNVATSELTIHDLKTGTSRTVTTHGNRVASVAVDPEGTLLITGDMNGTVRVGSFAGGEPHLLLGNEEFALGLAVDPQKKWVVSSEFPSPTLRLWPMPEGRPLHTLPRNELLALLRTLTNIRVVEDRNSTTGYRVTQDPFPGWEKLPTW